MNNFNSSFDDFSKEIKKNLKILIQNIQQISTNNTKENTSKNTENTLKLEDNSVEKESPYQLEINKMKELITSSEKYNSTKNELLQGLSNTSDVKTFQNLVDSCEETSSFLEQLGLDSSEFSNIFTSAFEDVIKKSESFSDSMKNMLDDLKNYFVKTIAKAISDSLISKQDSDMFLSSVNSSDSSGGLGGITSILSSFIGLFGTLPSHHSGGVIPSAANYSLPGTQEYLAVLKGGERVLSPAENTAYNDSVKSGNVIVNNFNVQAWDSKDVQKYLLDNKNLLANITADNIKYNNANLRYMIGG